MTEKLLATLSKECEALQALHTHFERQLTCIRNQELDRLEALTHEASDTLTKLNALSQARARQMRLARRLFDLSAGASLEAVADAVEDAPDASDEQAATLRARREDIRTWAARTQELADELSFALEHAASLGREVISVLRAPVSPPPAQGYTKTGETTSTDQNSFVNQVG